jgi:hypothetical protein
MALQNLLGDLSLESTQQELLGGVVVLLAAMLEKMPRVDVNDRLMVNTADQGNVTVALAAAQTLATVTTVGTLTTAGTLQNLGTQSRPADAMPMHASNAGAMHIYDNIKFS